MFKKTTIFVAPASRALMESTPEICVEPGVIKAFRLMTVLLDGFLRGNHRPELARHLEIEDLRILPLRLNQAFTDAYRIESHVSFAGPAQIQAMVRFYARSASVPHFELWVLWALSGRLLSINYEQGKLRTPRNA